MCKKLTEEHKSQVLDQMRSTGKLPYRRYSGSPLRYAGGKSLAVGTIIERIPAGITRVVSPFFGGGSTEIAIANELGLKVVGYDIFEILTNFWQRVLQNPVRLVEELEKFEATPDCFKAAKEELRKHWKGEERIRSPYRLAAIYYFTHNTSYGPGFLAWPSSVYMREDRWQKMIAKIRNFRAPNLTVKNASFEQILGRHRDSFLYLDPPYILRDDDEESKMFIGMYPMRNFPVHHDGFDHGVLAELLHQHRGGFLLSYNDCPLVRTMYQGYKMEFPKWQYTFGQGERRIGENRQADDASHVKESHEILVYKDPE